MIHFFDYDIAVSELPTKFTYPFCYTPHPLCVNASRIVRAYVASRKEWLSELNQGKMFGVLVVKTLDGKIGFISAFSGNIMGTNNHQFFVPAAYDFILNDSLFKTEERCVSELTIRIVKLENDKEYIGYCTELQELINTSNIQLCELKCRNVEAKRLRNERKKNDLTAEEKQEMIYESQFKKAEYKRLEKSLTDDINSIKSKINEFKLNIENLKTERKAKSVELQSKLFTQFKVRNAKGEIKSLIEIFGEKKPQAGSGECAAPKLLQYAFANSLTPVAMAEFWWGESPKGEVRQDSQFYPSCQGRCKPILTFMMDGLVVDENPLEQQNDLLDELDIVYEDEWLIAINKPSGVLSVDGKSDLESINSTIKNLYPLSQVAHRLDMATSGIILAAKNIDIYKKLQSMFENRTVTKRYIAILGGVLKEDKGIIDLPICLNPLDRPRQIVNYEYGKPAKTIYKVTNRTATTTRVEFYPITGRTHQLRVHAAYIDGLNAPIVGDTLYGTASERLYLHADYISFTHPITFKKIEIKSLADF